LSQKKPYFVKAFLLPVRKNLAC